MPSMHYAGIGPQNTPGEINDIFMGIARCLWRTGYALRTGCELGADFAFMIGAPDNKLVLHENFVYVSRSSVVGQIGSGVAVRVDYMPGDVFFMEEQVKEHHPNPFSLQGLARKRMRRGALCVLPYCRVGLELPQVDFVVCWAPDGSIDDDGELGHVLRLARRYGIPVFNLEPDAAGCLDRLWAHLRDIDVCIDGSLPSLASSRPAALHAAQDR